MTNRDEAHHREQGFRPIGNLMSEISSSLKPTAEIGTGSAENGRSSSITTSPRALSVPTGTPDGEHGFSTLPILSEAIRAELLPAVIDKILLASLKSSISRSLIENDDGSMRLATKADIGEVVMGIRGNFRVLDTHIGLRAQDLKDARAMVDLAMAPLPMDGRDGIMAELARLRVSTKARNEAPTDAALRLQVFREEIERHPADVARQALRRLGRECDFYPSFAELERELQRGSRRRRALAAALR